MQLIRGRSRVVWLVGKYAVKFPRLWSWELFVEGLLSNALEVQFYNRLCKYGHENLVAPILRCFIGKAIVVMPRCRTLTEEEAAKLDRTPWASYVRNSYEGFEVSRDDNFGIYEGRVVAIDYGLPDWMFYEQRERWEKENPTEAFRDEVK